MRSITTTFLLATAPRGLRGKEAIAARKMPVQEQNTAGTTHCRARLSLQRGCPSAVQPSLEEARLRGHTGPMPIHNQDVTAREGYAIWASFYDEEQNPLIMTEEPRVRPLLETLPSPATALDVATGTGRWAVDLARRGMEVIGVDASPEMLAVAREKADAAHLSIDFREVDLSAGLPFPDGSFDLVVCALALGVFDDLSAPIAECARVTRPGGHLLITDFHPQAVRNGWHPVVLRENEGYILPHPDHGREDYLDSITASGCEIVHLEEILVREQPPESLTAPDLAAFLRDYGDWPMCLIVLARRIEMAGA
jgi:ubiquinone/menaquinone biosynthesis C-methylase UbiE